MISIIIATYNRSSTLPRALNSIFKQSYQDFEIIVIDDGSTDSTFNVISNFTDGRLRYFQLDVNHGATYARNFGLNMMRGDYFLVWDSDDELHPDALKTIITIFQKYPQLAVVSAPARSLLNNKEIYFPRLEGGFVPKEIVLARLTPPNHKVRIANSRLCGDIRYKSKNIDFLVNVEMAERGDWYCYPEYLADVILESDSNSLTINRKKTNLKLAKERAIYLSQYLDKYRNLLIEKCPEKYAGFSYGTSIGFLAANNKIEALVHIKEAWRFQKNIRYLALYFLILIPFGREIFAFAVKIKNLII